MKIVIQRVKEASVKIENKIKNQITSGLLLLVAVEDADTDFDLDYAVRKISKMRIFSDENGKMNLSVQDNSGEVLSISQFTLYADIRKGTRPFRMLGILLMQKRCTLNLMKSLTRLSRLKQENLVQTWKSA